MKVNWKVLIFIFSVILNVVFIGTFTVHKMSIISTNTINVNRMNPLFLELDLSADQLAEFNHERDAFYAQMQETGLMIKAKQIELIDILEGASTDQPTIEKKQAEIQCLQKIIQDRVIVHFLKEKALLTPKQQSRFFQLVRDRIERNIQTGPPWMRSGNLCQTGDIRNE